MKTQNKKITREPHEQLHNETMNQTYNTKITNQQHNEKPTQI